MALAGSARRRSYPHSRCLDGSAFQKMILSDIWLNGTFCSTYEGPMADHEYGARRNGVPFINKNQNWYTGEPAVIGSALWITSSRSRTGV